MKSKKSLQSILIIVVILIWTGVFYRIYLSSTRKSNKIKVKNEYSSTGNTELINKLNKLRIDFNNKKINDPFRSFTKIYSEYRQLKNANNNNSRVTLPAYLLKGIVWDTSDPQAILVKSKIYKNKGKMKIGETIIVGKNSTIDYGTVLEIQENCVIISTYNQKFKLRGNVWEKIK
ncbi:MAG: hypothetical protein KKH98_11090 [Spirochaetes bacterium]|nr:hypothetical protein [Spirochaetota bacterium]